MSKTLGDLTDRGEVFKTAGRLFGKVRWEELRDRIVKELEGFHSRYPLRPGMPKEALKRKFPLEDPLFDEILKAIEEIEVIGGRASLKGVASKISPEQLEQRARFEDMFREAKFSPPEREEVLRDFDKELFRSLVEDGSLIKVTEDLFFHKEVIEEAKKLVCEYLEENGEMRLKDMRDILGSTRKFVVPLAEYLDGIKFTKRSGDLRTPGVHFDIK